MSTHTEIIIKGVAMKVTFKLWSDINQVQKVVYAYPCSKDVHDTAHVTIKPMGRYIILFIPTGHSDESFYSYSL